MKHVVITGSTRGIGYGLADAFLARSCTVTICGRSQESLDEATDSLAQRHGAGWLQGLVCDVRLPDQVQALWDAAAHRFGGVDIWINNAGISHRRATLWELDPEEMDDVVGTNILGTLYGSRVAMQGMLQQGHGALYNLEGLGSDGRVQPSVSVYGTTKRAIRYLTRALIQEAEGTPVLVGSLSPGMVVTDLLFSERRDEDAKRHEAALRIFRILADRVETVTPWLAEEVLENTKHGARIAWLTPGKVAWRFVSSPFQRRLKVAKALEELQARRENESEEET